MDFFQVHENQMGCKSAGWNCLFSSYMFLVHIKVIYDRSRIFISVHISPVWCMHLDRQKSTILGLFFQWMTWVWSTYSYVIATLVFIVPLGSPLGSRNAPWAIVKAYILPKKSAHTYVDTRTRRTQNMQKLAMVSRGRIFHKKWM